MKIILNSKKKLNNKLIIIENKNISNLSWNDLLYCKKLKLSKWEYFKIWLFEEVNNWNIVSKLFLIIENIKIFSYHLEDIVSWIWDILSKINKNFLLDLNITSLNSNDKDLFIKLLSIKLYSYDGYKTQISKKYNELVINDKSVDEKKMYSYINSLILVRDLVNSPANKSNPIDIEKKIISEFKDNKFLNISVLNKDMLLKKWLNWIYEVWKWSEIDPRMVVIEYRPRKNEWYKFAYVWKWVCFDTWWYNLKPTWWIEWMKLDMAWWAVLIWLWKYLIETNYQNNFVIAIPLVENMISHNAYKPWDVIKMYNWKTVEIWNTDAEWRLILADALSYVEEKYKPFYIFDIATLTWAQIVALWTRIWAIIWPNTSLNKKIVKLSYSISERFWELPFYKPYFKSYKSFVADMSNLSSWKMWPWTITAWLFLSEFVKNKNWIHFDIAWPAWIFWWPDQLWWEWASWFWFRTLVKITEEI